MRKNRMQAWGRFFCLQNNQQIGYALIEKGGISYRTCYNSYNQEQIQCMSRYKFIDTVNNLEGL